MGTVLIGQTLVHLPNTSHFTKGKCVLYTSLIVCWIIVNLAIALPAISARGFPCTFFENSALPACLFHVATIVLCSFLQSTSSTLDLRRLLYLPVCCSSLFTVLARANLMTARPHVGSLGVISLLRYSGVGIVIETIALLTLSLVLVYWFRRLSPTRSKT